MRILILMHMSILLIISRQRYLTLVTAKHGALDASKSRNASFISYETERLKERGYNPNYFRRKTDGTSYLSWC